uniref:Uncharacterized protein n=2 Tax=Anguilla anguilla TaxID=7936 RepID=A0A0E9QUP2_ANGAN
MHNIKLMSILFNFTDFQLLAKVMLENTLKMWWNFKYIDLICLGT